MYLVLSDSMKDARFDDLSTAIKEHATRRIQDEQGCQVWQEFGDSDLLIIDVDGKNVEDKQITEHYAAH